MDARRILIADSDGDSRTVYRIVLQHHGYDVIEAADGETALKLARESGVTLLVSELTLRSVDGHTLLEQLKSDEATSHIRVVILTARGLQDDRDRASRAGCTRFLTKPLQPIALLNEVRTLMEQKSDVEE